MTPQEAILSLIRSAIGGSSKAEPSLDAACIDWKAVMKTATAQGVQGLCFETLSGSPLKGESLPMDCLMEWIGRVNFMENIYEEHKKAIEELAAFYASHGIKMMLLKGYGLSHYWPKPNHRPAGDIDVYLFGQWQKADQMIAQKLGITVDNGHHHHSVFGFEKTMVENHYDFINVHSHRSNTAIEATFKRLAETGSTEDKEIQNLLYPSDMLNMLFVARHNAIHFASEKLTLRQMLDWAFLVKHVSSIEGFDWTTFWTEVENMGMLPFVLCMNEICVKHFGFNREIFREPEGAACSEGLADRMLHDVFEPECTGEHKRGLSYLSFRTHLWWVNRWKHKMVYSDSLISTFFVQLKSHLMRPKTIFGV